jgi:hypothetical protein
VSNYGVEFSTQLARQGQELSESGFTGLKDWQDKATTIVGGKVFIVGMVQPPPAPPYLRRGALGYYNILFIVL